MREFREKRWVVQGPAAIVNGHRKYAETLLGQTKRIFIELGGLNEILKRFVLPDGTKITVRSTFGEDEIKIDASSAVSTTIDICPEIALEAGMVNVWPFNPNDLSTFNPATISPVNSPDDDIYTINPLPAVDTPAEVESESFSSCQPSIAVSVEDEALNDALGKKKLAMYYYPASIFTGEMRLFMQALYSTPVSENFQLTTESDFLQKRPLLLLGQTIDSIWGTSSGIFIEGDDYWLVNITSSGVSTRQLQFTECGEKLQVAFNEGELDISNSVYRAFLYSQVAGFGEEEILSSEDFVEATGKGSPWYYGWKFNSTTRAASVAHVTTNMAGQFVGSLSTISLSRSDGEWVFGVTLSGDDTYYFDRGYDKLWLPEEFGGGMTTLVTSDSIPQVTVSAVPIYCYYDDADNLEVVRFSNSTATNTDTNPDYNNYPGNTTICGDGGGISQSRTRNASETTHGFTVSGSSYLTSNTSGGTHQFEDFRILGLDNATEGHPGSELDCSGADISDIQGGDESTLDFYNGSHTIETTSIAGNNNGTSILMIPWWDASAAYLGEYFTTNITQKLVEDTNNIRGVGSIKRGGSTIFSGGLLVSLAASASQSNNGLIRGTTTTTTTFENRKSSSFGMTLHTRSGAIQIASESTDTLDLFGGWEAIHTPSLFSPFIGTPFIVSQSSEYADTNLMYTGDINQNEFNVRGIVDCGVDNKWRFIGWI